MPVNSTLEIKSAKEIKTKSKKLANKSSNGFRIISYFGPSGTVNYDLNVNLYGLVEEVRIRIFEQAKNWILIYEIAFF